MRRSFLPFLAIVFSLSSVTGSAQVRTLPQQFCRPTIKIAERQYGIPSDLLIAIGHVESGRIDPRRGTLESWPWTVNVEGKGYFYDTKDQAIAAVRGFIAQGRRSIDIGCMQVNLMYHPTAFATLDEAFDPRANSIYAARFLRTLFQQTGSWTTAAALYHSATPALGLPYQQRVLAAWSGGRQQLERNDTLTKLSAAWAATLGGEASGTTTSAPSRPAMGGIAAQSRRRAIAGAFPQ